MPLNKLFHAYIIQLKHLPFLISGLVSCTNFCVLFAFISSESFIYIDIYQLSPKWFGCLFSGNAIMLVIGNILSHHMKNILSRSKTIFLSLGLVLLGGILMLFAINVFVESVLSVVLPLLLISFSVGILYPELMSYPLDNVVDYTGIASSLVGAMRFSLASLIGFVMGFVIFHSAWPLAMAIIILNYFTMFLVRIYFRKLVTGGE